MFTGTCKFCSCELPESRRPKIIFSCRRCKHKYYTPLNRDRINAKQRERYRPEKAAERHQLYKKLNPDGYKARVDRSHRSFYRRHDLAKRQAERRGYEFALTKEQHTELLTKPCHYCGGELPPKGSGLDRMDNSRGYTPDNVVPCCKVCNRIKCEHLTHDEMTVAISAVMNLRRIRNLKLA